MKKNQRLTAKLSQFFNFLFKDRPGDEPGKRTLAIVSVLGAASSSILSSIGKPLTLGPFLFLLFGLILFSVVLFQIVKGKYNFAAIIPLAGSFFMANLSISQGTGTHNGIWFGVLGVVILLFLFVSNEILATILSMVPILVFAAVGFAELNGYIPNPGGGTREFILVAVGNLVTVIFLVFYVFRRQHNLLERISKNNFELRELNQILEERVRERTHALEIASDVSRQITQVINLGQLLPQLVEKTREGFSLYFASVYLYEENTQKLVLAAGTGEAGLQMKREGKTYLLSDIPSLIALAGRERRSVVINDVTQSESYHPNPYLPDTRSEISVPMIVNNELVGVLGLQSEEIGHFQENDIQIFSTLAEQIAIAVRNAQLYREQENVAAELARTDLMKSQFLASMSHELRTPLNAIINFTQLITMGTAGPVTEDQKAMLNTSLGSSKHLLQLINDVLDISKIQAGKLSLYIEEDVNLYDEIETLIGMATPLLQKKNALLEQSIQLIQDIDNNLPLIACDRRRIRQVLLNLLSNAIKFTDKGTITLSVKQRGVEIIFAVMDTGMGIALEMQAQIFEPFVQTMDGVKHSQGTGLGLPISRSLIQAHGGELWLESRVGEGSTFSFTLPIIVC